MNIILLGPPGAGKGTQSVFISKVYEVPGISTGDMLRTAVAEGTPLGKEAKSLMDQGLLVPDDLIIRMLMERIQQDDCQKGCILDGVPRTLVQAERMDELKVPIDFVLNFSIPIEEVVARLSGRRVCSKCGATYHVLFQSSKEEGICDLCGSDLIIRTDDQPESIQKRMEVYQELTEPLIAYYEKQGKLHQIDALGTTEEVEARIREVLGEPV